MAFQVRTLKLAAPAGAGIKSGGQLLSKILIAHGFYVHDYTEYPSLVRGGHNTFQISFSKQPFHSPYRTVDLFFSVSPNHWQNHQSEFSPDTLIFDDTDSSQPVPGRLLVFPRSQFLAQLGNPKTVNILYLGLAAYLLNLSLPLVEKLVSTHYPSDTAANLSALQLAYRYAAQHYRSLRSPVQVTASTSVKDYCDGNEAFAQGLLRGKCDFYAAYPMTPATGVLHYLAEKQADHPVTVVHPEDEIAAANMASGAAFAGARAATGTSGGGYALMNETVSFCGVAEIGLVYYLVSRPGPATGMPTWTSQGDLLHAVYSGHGEFPKVVISPSDHLDSFNFAWQSLNLAQTLQTPIIVLSDKLLAESSSSLKPLSRQKVTIETGCQLKTAPPNYQRYSLKTKNGISPLTIPGTKGGEYLCNSYEHDQSGFSTEDAQTAAAMVSKRFSKQKKALGLAPKALFFGSPNALRLIISWGSTKGAILEALRHPQLAGQYAYLHLRTLWPLNPNLVHIIGSYQDITVIEANHTGQLTTLLKSGFDFNPTTQILKSDGRPFFPEELVHKLGQSIKVKPIKSSLKITN